MLWKSSDKLGLPFLHYSFFFDDDELEVPMHPALDAVSTKTQIYVALASKCGVILVERVVETLVKRLQVEQDDGASRFHADFDTVDAPAHLRVLLVFRERGSKDDSSVFDVQQT
jgi:hypothetical protein